MIIQEEKMYRLIDTHNDDELVDIMCLDEARNWLADLWNNNPDDDMDDEEHEEMIEAIQEADEEELKSRLDGVGYYIVDNK